MPGETTAQGLARLASVLQRERPALMILCLGINDFLRSEPEDAIRANLLAMIHISNSAAVPVLLLAVPLPGSPRAHPVYAQVAAVGGALLEAEAKSHR